MIQFFGCNKVVTCELRFGVQKFALTTNWQKITKIVDLPSVIGSADRWLNGHNVSTKTVTREQFANGQTEVPNNPKYFMRTVVVSSNTADSYVGSQHRIEDVSKLSGKKVALSFWAKANGNKNISIKFMQRFGTGGSAEIDGIGVQKFALTTNWQKITKIVDLPSVIGKTIGLDSYLQLVITFDAGSALNALTDSLGNQSGTFDIANVSLVEGSVAVECQNQPYADVLRECQRYYVRKLGSAIYSTFANGISISTTICHILFNLSPIMRVTPISIEYSSLSNFAIYDGSSAPSPSSLVLKTDANLDGSNLTIIATVSGVGAYRPIQFNSNNIVGTWIAFNAEL